eukprot:gene14183-16723_t
MEGNKDEALRCIEIALEKAAAGNKEGAVKFLNKSIALYPTSRAKDLLLFYSKDENTSSPPTSTSSSTGGKPSSTQSSSTPSSSSASEEPSKPKYTAEQVAAIKKIKRCKSYYEVLDIPKTANDSDIKKAYRKLALQMHPDKNHAPGAEEAFKLVTQAFSCLSDSNKRASYDLHGEETQPGVPTRNPFGGGGGGQRGGMYYEEEMSPEDIFNIFFGIPTRGGGRGGGVRHRGNANPFGNQFQFHFGGMPQQAARRQQQQQQGNQQRGEQSSLFSLLMMLVPLLYVILSFFGSSSGASDGSSLRSLYSFTRSGYHVYPRTFEVKDQIFADYYVKSNYLDTLKYNGIPEQTVETEVRKDWMERKKEVCKKKRQMEDSMARYKATNQKYYLDQLTKQYEEHAASGLDAWDGLGAFMNLHVLNSNQNSDVLYKSRTYFSKPSQIIEALFQDHKSQRSLTCVNAEQILKGGFILSNGGQLGVGVYFSNEDKAERFAISATNRGKGAGAVVIQCKEIANMLGLVWSAEIGKLKDMTLSQAQAQHDFLVPVIHFYHRDQPNYQFTNFATGFPIDIDGQTWPTTEHYFQAQKFQDPMIRDCVRRLQSSREAMDYARANSQLVRRDWLNDNVAVMKRALNAKFNQHKSLKDMLLRTGECMLVEHTVNDKFWGDGGDGSGKNMLGVLLMDLRSEIQTQQISKTYSSQMSPNPSM